MSESIGATPHVVQLAPQACVSVRMRLPGAGLGLGAVFAQQLPRLFGLLGARSLAPAGAPFGRYHEFGAWVDVEVGIPVASPVPELPELASIPAGEVGSSALPGGPAATLLHIGPYSTLGPDHDRLTAWVDANGYRLVGGPWESYVDDPADVTDPADLRTELFVSVERG